MEDFTTQASVIVFALIISLAYWTFKPDIDAFRQKPSAKMIKHDIDLKLVFKKFTTLMYKKQDNYQYALFVLADPTPIDEMIGKFNNTTEFFDSESWKFVPQHVPDQVENFDMFDLHLKYEKYRAIRGHWVTLSEAQIFNYNHIRNHTRKLIKNRLLNRTDVNFFEYDDNYEEQTNSPYDIDRLSDDLLSYILRKWEKRNELDFKSLKKKEHDEELEQFGLDRDRYYDGIIVDCKNGDVDLEKLRNTMILISKDSEVLKNCDYVMNHRKELREKINDFREEIQKILDEEGGIKGDCKICNPKFSSDIH